MIDTNITVWKRAFNSPLETGIRALAILLQAYPEHLDLSRLLYFDYLIVHSGDIPDGPESLHSATPHRTGELLVRRGLVEQGVNLMATRGLVEVCFDSTGINYRATETTAAFLVTLSSPYILQMREIAEWVFDKFKDYSVTALDEFMRNNIDRWGAEFESESVVRETPE